MHPTLHSLHVNHISVQKYTPNNTHPILRIREMYTVIYMQSYASHSTYQDTYIDIYKWSYASHSTYQDIVYHANAMLNKILCSAKLSNERVKPYGMAAQWASTSPRPRSTHRAGTTCSNLKCTARCPNGPSAKNTARYPNGSSAKNTVHMMRHMICKTKSKLSHDYYMKYHALTTPIWMHSTCI